MPVLADPTVTAIIAEFSDVVDHLKQSADNPAIGEDARIEVIKQLCELSRDARFHLGPAEFADRDQLEEVANCFANSVVVIRSLWTVLPAAVSKYCDNISERATNCR